MARQKPEFDIVIAGSGLTGLALAVAVGKTRPALRIAVIDPVLPSPREDADAIGLRVSALTPGSIANFEALGVWQSMPDSHVQHYASMRVWDAGVDCGDGILFDAAAMGQTSLGCIADNAMLRDQLWHATQSSGRVEFLQAAVSSVSATANEITIDLDNERRVTARLLVGADGRSSHVRDCAGIEAVGWSHQQKALVAHLRPQFDHGNCAFQRFLPDGPMALLPLPDHRVSLVFSAAPDTVERLQAMPDGAFEAQMTAASDGVLGDLSLDSARASFPLESRYARDPVAARCVLVGDAAHAVHPLAGQGANLGFSDVSALTTVIDTAMGRGEDPGDAPVLRRYRRARMADNLSMVYGLDFINRLFARGDGSLAAARQAGMRWFDRIGIAKHLAAGHAMRGGVLPQGMRE